MLAAQLTRFDSAERETCSALAASVTVTSISSSAPLTILPGCTGSFMGIANTSSVIVIQINVERLAILKTEHDAPVSRHPHAPVTVQIAGERMEAIARDIHLLDGLSSFEHRENLFNTAQHCGANGALIALLVQAFESVALEASDHTLTVA